MLKLWGYLRCSTQKQGDSGLGLASQRATIEAFAQQNGHKVVGWTEEVESGTRCDRQQLAKAVDMCKLMQATICVARQDRLGRDAGFVLSLKRNNIEFAAVDNPTANTLLMGISAVTAEYEAKLASERTKAALRALRSKGVQLGGARLPGGFKKDGTPKLPPKRFNADEARKGAAIAVAARQKAARERAVQLMPIIAELRTAGATTLQALADALNAKGLPTSGGKRWHATSVMRVINQATGA